MKLPQALEGIHTKFYFILHRWKGGGEFCGFLSGMLKKALMLADEVGWVCGAILHSWIIGLAKTLHLYHWKLPVPIIPDYVKIALGCFFSGANGHGGGGWSAHVFLLLQRGKALSQRRNDWRLCALWAMGLQKMWQKKTTEGLAAGKTAKRLCKPWTFHFKWRAGIFDGWGNTVKTAKLLLKN